MRYLLLGIVGAMVLAAGTTQAANHRRRANLPNKQAIVGAYGKASYPKYHWGIHAREIQNIGTPPGDRGLRGDGIQWQPW